MLPIHAAFPLNEKVANLICTFSSSVQLQCIPYVLVQNMYYIYT